MMVLSDLLGVEHFLTSEGGSVMRDFLEAVALGLGATPEKVKSMKKKDDIITWAVETVTGGPMDKGLLSEGGTVTNPAIQAIIDGVLVNGVPGQPKPPQVEPNPVAEEGAEADFFDPALVKDARDKRLMAMAMRQGQDKFRLAVLEAYGERCAVTEFEAVETLQAAHIYPYRGPATNKVSNGLLLRADIHLLYDRGAISVHETTHQVLLKPHLAVTRYADLEGSSLRLPSLIAHRPNTAALRGHREWAGL